MGRNFVYLIGFENAGNRDIRRVFLNEIDATSWDNESKPCKGEDIF